MFKPNRLLVPTDRSDPSYKAMRIAFDIARQYNSEVFLLHVIQDPVRQCAIDFCIAQELFVKLQEQMIESVREEMMSLLERFPSIDPDAITTDVKIGVPYQEILKEADEREIDLIVISSLGSSGLAKYLVGSVARHVLFEAKCAVLLTR